MHSRSVAAATGLDEAYSPVAVDAATTRATDVVAASVAVRLGAIDDAVAITGSEVEKPVTAASRTATRASRLRPAAWFLFCDVSFSLIAYGLALRLRADVGQDGALGIVQSTPHWSMLALPALTFFIFYCVGLYEPEILALRALHLLTLAKAALWAAALGALFIYTLQLPVGLQSRLVVLPTFVLFIVFAALVRTLVLPRILGPSFRTERGGSLVVGWPYRTEPLRERLQMLKGFSNVSLADVGRAQEIAGVVAARLRGRNDEGLPAIGSLFIDAGSLSRVQTLDLIALGRDNGAVVYVVSNRLRPLGGRRLLIDLFEAPVVRVHRTPGQRTAEPIKRAFDICVAGVALLLLSPLMLAITLAVKLTSRGRVLYAQERIGRDGKPFRFYKFRSMQTGCDSSVHAQYVQDLIKGQADTRCQMVEGEVQNVYKLVDDPRVTAVGRLLRRYSLDELPQFWNVLIGDMSIVGPRPPLPYEVSAYEPWHMRRLDVKPGITGPWQVDGRCRVGFDDMVFQDILYDCTRDALVDTALCLRTVPAALLGHGAA